MIKSKFYFFLIMIFSSVVLSAQVTSNDNLLRSEIKNKAQEFTKEINFNKAQLFYLDNNWDSTLVYSMKQLSEAENKELNDYCYYFRVLSFYKKKLFDEAKNEFTKISVKFKFYYKVELVLGEIALEQKEFKKALLYFRGIEKLLETDVYDFKRSTVLHNIGLCYLHLEKFDKAEEYLFKSAYLQAVERDTLLLIGSYTDIANLYYVQYKDSQAIPYFEKGYQLAKKVKSFELKRTAASNMAVVEENRKNFPVALAYRKEYEMWNDSLNDQNKVWAIADLEKKFAVTQKQKEVNLLQAENKVKIAERNSLLFSSVFLLILFGTGVYFYRNKVKGNKIILAQKIQLDELNAAKDKLFSIVSHDLRSSVSALKTSNAKLQQSLDSKNYLELDIQLHDNSAIANGTYNLLDNLLHWALLQTKQSYFHKECLRLFFIVEQMVYNYKPLMLDKNIDFENKLLKRDVVNVDQQSLKIILRNLLDNAIKFSKQDGSIIIYSQYSDANYCDLVIEDTGLGMEEGTRQELMKERELSSNSKNSAVVGTGLGLQLCKAMIEKNGGKFRIESTVGKGTKMIVSLEKTQKDG
jgi:signal transduction histidine kinase